MLSKLPGLLSLVHLATFSCNERKCTEEMLQDCLEQAKYDYLLHSATLVSCFGGSNLIESDTIWSSPAIFDPWWSLCKRFRSYNDMIKGIFNIVRKDCDSDFQR